MAPTIRSIPQVEHHLIASVLAIDSSADAVRRHVESLTPSEIRSILAVFESSSHNLLALQVLPRLWNYPPLQPAILSIFCRPSFYLNSAHERLIDETEVLLAADARDGSRTTKFRAQLVSVCATAVSRHVHHDSAPYAITLLVFSANAASQIRTRRGRSLQSRILKYLLSVMAQPSKLHVRPLVAMLNSDIHLDAEDELVFLRALNSFIAVYCEDRQLPHIFYAVVTALGRAESSLRATMLGRISLKVLQKATQETLANVFDILRTAIIDSETVAQRLVNSVNDIINPQDPTDVLTNEQEKIAPSHISLMYFLLGSVTSQALRDKVQGIVQLFISDKNVPFDTSCVASSSANAAEPPYVLAFRLVNSTQIPAVCANAEAIATIFEGQVWSRDSTLRSWGVRMLFDMFVMMPQSRAKVVKATLSALSNSDTPTEVALAFCHLLEELCDSRKAALYLRDFRPDLQDLLNFSDGMSPRVDCRVVSAIVRLSVSNPFLSDHVFSFIRKAAGSRLLKLQRIAGTGLLALIQHDLSSEETQIEACNTFGEMLELSEAPLRTHLILDLMSFVDGNRRNANQMQRICELVMGRLLNCPGPRLRSAIPAEKDPRVANGSESPEVFEQRLDQLAVVADMPIMVRLCYKLKMLNNSIAEYLDKLSDYLGNTRQVLENASADDETRTNQGRGIDQLCYLYETMICVDPVRFAPGLLCSYSVCLFAREYDYSNVRRGTSSSDDRALPKRNDDFAVLASVSAREAVSTDPCATQDAFTEESATVAEYVRALHVISSSNEKAAWIRLAQHEFLKIILTKLRSSYETLNLFSSMDEMQHLTDIISDCFAITCPWKKAESPHYRRSDCCLMAMQKIAPSEGNELTADGKPNDVSNGRLCRACEQAILGFLSSLGFPHRKPDHEPAVSSSRVNRLVLSLLVSIRHLSIAILVAIVPKTSAARIWPLINFFLRLAKEPLRPCVNTETPETGEAQSHAKVLQVYDQNLTSPLQSKALGKSKQGLRGEEADCRQAAAILSRSIRLEFEHSLSPALSMSYVELFFYILRATDERHQDGIDVRSTIVSTMTALLREYSIRHSRVLKRIVALLLKSYDVEAGISFGASLLRDLGGEITLERPDSAARTGDSGMGFRVDDFDDDILEEAIWTDSQPIDSEALSIPQQRNRPSRDLLLASKERVLGHEDSTCAPVCEEAEVRTLCVGETEENAALSVLCVLEYYENIARGVLESQRRATIVISEMKGSDIVAIHGIVNALRDTFKTPLVRVPVAQAPKMLLPLWKRLTEIIQYLTELVEVQLRTSTAAFQRNRGKEDSAPELTSLLTNILRFFFKEGCMKIMTSSSQFVGQRSRMTFLQEKLDATATAFVLSTENVSSDRITGLRALLQSRIREIGVQKVSKDRADESNDVVSNFDLRPRKRSHMRSRNRYVDGCLAEEKGDDNFVDLEDFIVPIDEEPT